MQSFCIITKSLWKGKKNRKKLLFLFIIWLSCSNNYQIICHLNLNITPEWILIFTSFCSFSVISSTLSLYSSSKAYILALFWLRFLDICISSFFKCNFIVALCSFLIWRRSASCSLLNSITSFCNGTSWSSAHISYLLIS